MSVLITVSIRMQNCNLALGIIVRSLSCTELSTLHVALLPFPWVEPGDAYQVRSFKKVNTGNCRTEKTSSLLLAARYAMFIQTKEKDLVSN